MIKLRYLSKKEREQFARFVTLVFPRGPTSRICFVSDDGVISARISPLGIVGIFITELGRFS